MSVNKAMKRLPHGMVQETGAQPFHHRLAEYSQCAKLGNSRCGKEKNPFCVALLLFISSFCFPAWATEISIEQAWQALPKYQAGQDMAPLLAIDRVIIQAMGSKSEQAACAARLGALLSADGTSNAARKYICLQLRQVGTAAEVPLLKRFLSDPELSDVARGALQSIPGERSVAALRDSLSHVQGKALVGIVNSLGTRRDTQSVPRLMELADSADPTVSSAALRALSKIANVPACEFLWKRAAGTELPTPTDLTVALLDCLAGTCHVQRKDWVDRVLEFLVQGDQTASTRRVALEIRLHPNGQLDETKTVAWLADSDPQRRRLAAGHLQQLNEEHLDGLLASLADLPESSRWAVIQVAASRRGAGVLPAVMEMATSESSITRRAGLRYLGTVGDATAIPVLLDALSANDRTAEVAQESLSKLPRKPVTEALLDALQKRGDVRVSVISVLKRIKCYEAIDPLIQIALNPDPAVYDPALDGLRVIADPDKTDIPRLVQLLLKAESGRHRDEVAKTILMVTEKLPASSNRSKLVIASLEQANDSELAKAYPLLGRLGGPASLKMIQAGLESDEPEIHAAAVRGLCNWPHATVAEQLLEIASNSPNKTYRRWALRAYIRVVTLDSDRPEIETLGMLKHAVQLAESPEDKRLALIRAATIRRMESVDWIVPFLDDPQLAQAACRAIVELAHHRFLRHPNMARFGPILDRVAKISDDPSVVERAQRYRLGL